MSWGAGSTSDDDASELVDVVNNFDEVIGVVERREAHARGLTHRIVAVLLLTNDGRFIVQIRKDNGQADHSAGGHVRAGEEYRVAARRELAEELGVSVDLSLVGCTSVNETSGARHRMAVFAGVVDEEWEFSPTLEVERVEWWLAEDVETRMAKTPDWAANGFKSSTGLWRMRQG